MATDDFVQVSCSNEECDASISVPMLDIMQDEPITCPQCGRVTKLKPEQLQEIAKRLAPRWGSSQ